MAEAVVSFVVEKLGDLLIEEATLLWGVRRQVQEMQTELKRMKCFLKDADRRQDEDESLRNWVSEIREAAYDVEDLVETFVLRFSAKKGGRLRNSITKGRALHHVASRIETIKSRISDLTRSLQTYGIVPRRETVGSSLSSERQKQLRWSYSHVVEDYVVGFEEDIRKLVKQLVGNQDNCRVASICGMGGLGKTTIAKSLYHHGDIRRNFEGFAWAYVSQQCQKREIWEGILLKLINPTREEREEVARMKDDEVAKKLFKVQREKKCLIVIDDIWRVETWDTLKSAFPNVTENGSKILITTRNKEVALRADPNGFLHEPECLNEKQSWELFRRKAFLWRGDLCLRINEDMEKLGREMVRSCAGLPLAIIVLGGLLAAKETLIEWEMVHRNIKAYLARTKGREQYAALSEVLALSYHELPYQLKSCFLCLSQFPEDYEIPVKKIVQIWVAEGIVFSQDEIEEDETLEEVAKGYLHYLINRSMVQVGVRGSTGTIKTCRLHDLMRDLCLSMARRENFMHIVDRSGNEITDSVSVSRIRRLAIFLNQDVDGPIFPVRYHSISNLRSLFFFRPKKDILDCGQLVKSVVENFKQLKILDLEGVKGLEEKLPEHIGTLLKLRFLSLKKTRVRELPPSLLKLVSLQTLNMQTISKLSWESTVQLPDIVWTMTELRHLYLPKWCGDVTDKLQLANLSNLQTLVNFPANKCDVKDLLKLTELRKLVLNDPRFFETFVEIFKPLDARLPNLMSLSLKTDLLSFPDKVVNLRQLLLGCPRLCKLHIEGRVENLPTYDEFPPYLSKLTLWGSRLPDDPMPTLEKLPNLKYLSGWEMFTGNKMTISRNGFPQLKTLLLRGLTNVEDWMVEEGAMSSLHRLGISDCYKLKRVPDGLRFVTTLRELEIRWMPIAFKKGLQGEDFHKVQHVPSITFLN